MNALILLLFFVSGACGLAYEVIWSRLMIQMFGATALAVGTVLAAFMSGLALGSYRLGRRADRAPNPLTWYAFCEVGVGVSALVSTMAMIAAIRSGPWLQGVLGASPVLEGATRFVLAFVLMAIPTTLMGATLPILSRFVVRRPDRVGAGLGTLYAVNTAGAIAGSLLAGFVLIGAVGVHRTAWLAVAGNLAVGAVAWAAAGRSAPSTPAPAVPGPVAAEPATPGPLVDPAVLLAALALSGVSSFAYEVFWTRSLVFLFGNSTYAFTMMLTTFLAGIALGGWGIKFLADRTRRPLALLGVLQIAVGVTSVAAIPTLFAAFRSESVRGLLARNSDRVLPFIGSRFGLAAAVMVVPAALIGATFPLAGRAGFRDLGSSGSRIGAVYAANTVGNVVGALLPGWILIRALGVQGGIAAAAALNVSLGGFLCVSELRRGRAWRFAFPAAFLALLPLLPPLQGVFQFPSENQAPGDEVLFYREGPLATTKVFRDPDTGEKQISLDGITIGGTGATDYKQQLLAHLPKLLLGGFRTELSVGLGSGILVAESARHRSLAEVTCVEIEPTILEGARRFREETGAFEDDPRVRVVVDDVASFLRATRERYDIISADEKTAENYASNGFSFSRDYYVSLRDHLAPRGLAIQWMPSDLPHEAYRMVLRTFVGVFPHVTLWVFPAVGKSGSTNTLLMGTLEPPVVDSRRAGEALRTEAGAFRGIRKYGLTRIEAVLAHYVAGERTLRGALGPGAENSLEHPRYEFYRPGAFAEPSFSRGARNAAFLLSIAEPGVPSSWTSDWTADERRTLDEALHAEREFLAGFYASSAPDVARRLDSALARAPWNENLRREILFHHWNQAGVAYLGGRMQEALASMKRGILAFDGDGEARYYLGLTLLAAGRPAEAEAEFESAIALAPRLAPPRRALAALRARRKAAPGVSPPAP